MTLASRVLGFCLALLVGAGSLVADVRAEAAGRPIVLAQAERAERPGIFRFLFRNRRREQQQQQQRVIIIPAPQAQPPARQARPEQAQPRRSERRRRSRSNAKPRETARPRESAKPSKAAAEAKPRKQRRRRAAVAAAPPVQVEPVDKAPDARRVLVIGDFMAEAVAKGLVETYDQNANAMVVNATSGDSGLVRADHFDWAAKLPELVTEHRPDAIVLLIGANDRQPIAAEAGPQALDSEGWRAAYGARVSALADALRATAKPVLWAGLPPVRAAATSRHYNTVNAIVREQLEAKGLPFVDTWNGFVDEDGKFVAVGPDVGGQSVQLRTNDGLNFTKPGQRKLAFFLEQPLNGILGGAPAALAALDPASEAGMPPGAMGPAEEIPRISPMVPIEALVTGGGDLLSAAPAPAAGAPAPPGAPGTEPAVVATIAKRLTGDGDASAPVGRTDNYAWPAPRLALPPPPPGPPGAAPGVPQVAAAPIVVPPAPPLPPGAAPAAPGAVPAPAQLAPAPGTASELSQP